MNYNRLTEKIDNYVKLKSDSPYADLAALQKLAELEDEIENGTLVELLCKVGDTIYEVIKGLPVEEWKVETIWLTSVYPNDFLITACRKRDVAFWKFWGSQFGQNLFLTREEAEKKLAELKGEK